MLRMRVESNVTVSFLRKCSIRNSQVNKINGNVFRERTHIVLYEVICILSDFRQNLCVNV